MALAKLASDLVSRATALAVGLSLAYACWGVVGGIRAAARDAEAQRAQLPANSRTVGPQPLQFILAGVTGVPAILLVGFALLPTRALYAMPVGPPRDPQNDADTIGRWGRHL